MAIILFMIIVYLGMIALIFASLWKICVKAGRPGWHGILPIYNYIVLLEISKRPLWWIAMFFIPVANIVFMIMMLNGLSKAFGKDERFTVGLVLLGMVFFPILAFGKSKYIYSEVMDTDPDLLDA